MASHPLNKAGPSQHPADRLFDEKSLYYESLDSRKTGSWQRKELFLSSRLIERKEFASAAFVKRDCILIRIYKFVEKA